MIIAESAKYRNRVYNDAAEQEWLCAGFYTIQHVGKVLDVASLRWNREVFHGHFPVSSKKKKGGVGWGGVVGG